MAERHDPHGVMLFRVEINGVETGEFTKVTGLEGEIGIKTHRAGGDRYERKSPAGTVTHPPLVCTGGFVDLKIYNWWLDWAEGRTRERQVITIVQLDEALEPVQRINLYEAWPSGWKGPEYDASSEDGVAVEELTLQYEYSREA